MHRCSANALVFAVVLLLGLVLSGPGHAQEQASEVTDSAPGIKPGQPITRDDLLALIASEVVLAPGVGLRNLRLGEPLASVQDRLGPPASVTQSGVVRRFNILTYTLDGGTAVTLIGRDVVERIFVRGNAAALVRTVQGARFGMEPRLIQQIYRQPTRARDNRLEYRNQGITFYFGEQGGGQALSDGVSRIELYPKSG